jgi:hypothetical protein
LGGSADSKEFKRFVFGSADSEELGDLPAEGGNNQRDTLHTGYLKES